MRKALNENPVAQIGLLAVLGIAVALLLMTRLSGGGGEEPAAPSATSGSATSGADTSAGATGTAGTVAPSTAEQPSGDAIPAAPDSGSGTAPSSPLPGVSAFTAGPGLPKKVVQAYKDDKTIILFVYRRKGLDDLPVRFGVEILDRLKEESLPGRAERFLGKVAVFTTNAHHVARYSRIALGVDLNRVPALVVVQSRKRGDGIPGATVSYGYRDLASIVQAVKDSLYKGRQLPYYPE